MKSHFSKHIRRWVALALFGALLIAARLATSTQAFDEPAAKQDAQRFDHLVRADFFAGMAGNQERFAKAMKLCEDTLAKNPKHAEALVWHGAGLLSQGGQAFQKNDFAKGMNFWQRGLKEMNDAVALEPDNVGVLIPRGAVLLEASKHARSEAQAKALLETAIGDYEKVLKIQQPYFEKIGAHARGELLMGLAEGWHRRGDATKAKTYFERMVKEAAGTDYAARAQTWLEKKTLPQNHSNQLSCTGCHAR
ncbi:MAG TPA: hypothetical protein PKD31_06920 [Blastocatellia bacterium]|nr:hypothetical protein [Blastocatellia bacterium]